MSALSPSQSVKLNHSEDSAGIDKEDEIHQPAPVARTATHSDRRTCAAALDDGSVNRRRLESCRAHRFTQLFAQADTRSCICFAASSGVILPCSTSLWIEKY